MPRKQYPSDHRRFFRVMEDILDDPGYRALRPADKVAWIDLLALFNRYQAHRTANCIVLPWSRARSALSAQNNGAALARASRMSQCVGAHFARTPRGLLCLIPNYAKLQELTPRGFPPDSGATPPPTPTPTPTPTPSTTTANPPPSAAGEDPPEPKEPEEPPKGKEPDPPKKTEFIPKHPDTNQLCSRFRAALVREIPGFTPPSAAGKKSWLEEMDRLLRLDGPDRKGVDPTQVCDVIDWVVMDPFERAIVQHPKKLRARFSALAAKVQRPADRKESNVAAIGRILKEKFGDEFSTDEETQRSNGRSGGGKSNLASIQTSSVVLDFAGQGWGGSDGVD